MNQFHVLINTDDVVVTLEKYNFSTPNAYIMCPLEPTPNSLWVHVDFPLIKRYCHSGHTTVSVLIRDYEIRKKFYTEFQRKIEERPSVDDLTKFLEEYFEIMTF